MKPVCPECRSDKLNLVIYGGPRVECLAPDCFASFPASDRRLIEACLLSHVDVTGKPAPWVKS